MKVEEAVYASLVRCPTLYKRPSYEEAKRDVMHHYFIVLGNGLEWAHTKNPKHGGYLTGDKYYKRDGEWVRKYDKPYHKSGVIIDQTYLDKFFSQKLYYVWAKDWTDGSGVTGKHPNVWEEDLHTVDLTKWDLCEVNAGIFNSDWEPYPNFDKKYSCFWEDKVKYIQDDWLEAAIEHLNVCKVWFLDDKKFVNSRYQVRANELEERHKNYKLGCTDLLWYDKTFDWGGDFERLATLMNEKCRKESLQFIEETLGRLAQIQRNL